MARNKPFMFDYSFDDGADEARLAEIDAERRAAEEAEANRPPTFSVEEMEAAKTQAHTLGRQEGMADAMAGIEQQMARTLDAVFSRVPKVFEEHAAWTQTMEGDALRLAHTLMRKLAPELVREHELPEVEHVIREAFGFLTEQPKVMIRVAAELEEALSDKVDLMASRVGYEGQVVLVGDPELAIDDCRVSWQAGAVERALEDIWGQVDEIVDRGLTSQQQRDAETDPTLEATVETNDQAPQDTQPQDQETADDTVDVSVSPTTETAEAMADAASTASATEDDVPAGADTAVTDIDATNTPDTNEDTVSGAESDATR